TERAVRVATDHGPREETADDRPRDGGAHGELDGLGERVDERLIREQARDVVGGRLTTGRRERPDGDDGRREDQEQEDVRMERGECGGVPDARERVRTGTSTL